MIAKFKVGEMVSFATSGPDMIVQYVSESKQGYSYGCRWFCGHNILHTNDFPESELISVSEFSKFVERSGALIKEILDKPTIDKINELRQGVDYCTKIFPLKIAIISKLRLIVEVAEYKLKNGQFPPKASEMLFGKL